MRSIVDIFRDSIPVGHENAIGRGTLREAFGMSDRKIRKVIEEVRKEIPVINMSDGKGYFIPDPNNMVDCCRVNEYIAQEKARIDAIQKNIDTCQEWRAKYGTD